MTCRIPVRACFVSDQREHHQRRAFSQSESLAHFIDHGLLVGKVAFLQLRVDQIAIDRQFETTSTGRLQFEGFQFLFVLRENLARQTDGTGFVVSSSAITKFNLHQAASFFGDENRAIKYRAVRLRAAVDVQATSAVSLTSSLRRPGRQSIRVYARIWGCSRWSLILRRCLPCHKLRL